MQRPEVFAFRVSPEERKMIDILAEREERAPSDAVRRLIRQAVQNSERAPAAKQESAPASAASPS